MLLKYLKKSKQKTYNKTNLWYFLQTLPYQILGRKEQFLEEIYVIFSLQYVIQSIYFFYNTSYFLFVNQSKRKPSKN